MYIIPPPEWVVKNEYNKTRLSIIQPIEIDYQQDIYFCLLEMK